MRSAGSPAALADHRVENSRGHPGHATWQAAEDGAPLSRYLFRHVYHGATRRLQNAKDARTYQEHCEALGYEPLPDKELAEIDQTANDLKTRYGKEYKEPYGWAAILTETGRAPNLRDLERMAGLEHLRPFYGWASHAVHPGSKGIQLNLLSRADGSVRLAGPTNAFLADPGHGALLALLHVTTVLLVHGRKASARHFEHLVIVSALKTLVDDAGGALSNA